MDFGKLIDKRQWNAREKNQSPVTVEDVLIVTELFFKLRTFPWLVTPLIVAGRGR